MQAMNDAADAQHEDVKAIAQRFLDGRQPRRSPRSSQRKQKDE